MTSKTKPLPIYLDRLARTLNAHGVSLKRAQLLEVCASAFGYRNSNELTAAAKTSELVPPAAKPMGVVTLPDGQRIVVLTDQIANSPYAIDESFLEQVVAEERREEYGPTPYGHLASLELAITSKLDDISAATAGNSSESSTKRTLYYAIIEHKHGEDYFHSFDEDDLYNHLAGYVHEWWNDVKEYATADEGPDSKQTDRELVKSYFDLCSERELNEYLTTGSELITLPFSLPEANDQSQASSFTGNYAIQKEMDDEPIFIVDRSITDTSGEHKLIAQIPPSGDPDNDYAIAQAMLTALQGPPTSSTRLPNIPGDSLLGYQIADSMGRNIQGDENCPGGHSSYQILTPARAHEILASLPNGGKGYTLQPICRGDIEAATYASAENILEYHATPKSMTSIADTLEDGISADIWYDAGHHRDESASNEIEELQIAMEQAAGILRLRASEDHQAYELQINELKHRIRILETEDAELRDILNSYERTGCFDWTSRTKTLKGLKKHSHFGKGPMSNEDLDLLRLAVADNHVKSSEAERDNAQGRVRQILDKGLPSLLARLDHAEELLAKGEVMTGPVLDTLKDVMEVKANRDGHTYDAYFLPDTNSDLTADQQGILEAAKAFEIDDMSSMPEIGNEYEFEKIDLLESDMDNCETLPADVHLSVKEAVEALSRGEASVLVHRELHTLARQAGILPRGSISSYENNEG